MPDWKSPQELAKDGEVFIKFMHALLGLYAWEFATSLSFDWDFISGKKKFKWPMIFYFAGRYLLLFALIGIAVALDTTTQVNCGALYTFNQLAGDAAVGIASINLSIRTIAVWSKNKYVILFLGCIILGHWSLILQGVLLKAIWVDGEGCVIISTNNTVLAATFIYSMVFDLIVLTLSTYKLAFDGRAGRASGGSQIGRLIFGDGLIFFFIAFLANLLATVFMLLDLNQIMNVIFNVPAAVASTIVASRAVRRLTNFTSLGPEVYASTGQASATNYRPRGTASAVHGQAKSGVHVQMETFTHAEHGDAESVHKYDVDAPVPGNTRRQTVVLPVVKDAVYDGSTQVVEVDVEADGDSYKRSRY